MAYVEKILLPDEHIIYKAQLHWMIYAQGLAITAGGGLLAMICHPSLTTIFGDHLGEQFARPVSIVCGIIVLVGIVLLSGCYLRQTSTEIVITNKRLIAKYGVVARSTFEIMISRITGANFDQTVVGRLFGYGTVLVHGAGGEISPIDNVADPQLFYRALVSILEKGR